jgi:hypothetical protein
MKSTIFYFSGTGNSLYVAKKLAGSIGGCNIYSMAHSHPTEQIGGANEQIGFIFPSYYDNLPRIVQRFITDRQIHPETYIFGIVTMGRPFGQSGSINMLQKTLGEKGLDLQYGQRVVMPRNYIYQ